MFIEKYREYRISLWRFVWKGKPYLLYTFCRTQKTKSYSVYMFILKYLSKNKVQFIHPQDQEKQNLFARKLYWFVRYQLLNDEGKLSPFFDS